jgi:hypothetical protein
MPAFLLTPTNKDIARLIGEDAGLPTEADEAHAIIRPQDDIGFEEDEIADEAAPR